MSKRYQPQFYGRTIKKPKLDISVNKARTSNPTNPIKEVVQSNDLWDDDEDDVILLATQVAESQAATHKPGTGTETIFNITESEVSFSEFQPKLEAVASTSTQRPVANTSLAELFMHDDDDELGLIATSISKINAGLTTGDKTNNEIFKIPVAPTTSRAANETRKNCDLKSQLCQSDEMDLSIHFQNTVDSSSARRQLASERQIKFLMERVEALKKENAKLVNDVDASKNKMESKEGEASLLRDELRHMKQQIQALKVEKMCNIETVKSECKTKISQVYKLVEAKEAQLKLKETEFSKLKMRHADETRRSELSMRVLEEDEEKPSTSKEKTLKKIDRNVWRLSALHFKPPKIPNFIETRTSQLDALIYKPTEDKTKSKKRRNPFQEELDNFQKIVARTQLETYNQTEITDDIIKSVRKVLTEFWTYVHSLHYIRKNLTVSPIPTYNALKDESTRRPGCLHTNEKLYEGECAISLRRYIAALGVSCLQIVDVTRTLLNTQHENGTYPLLQIAIDAIIKLGYSSQLPDHFGVLESFVVLARSILVHINNPANVDLQQHVDLIINLLKQITFTRPSPWILKEISYCFWVCASGLPKSLDQFCINSAASTFSFDDSKGLKRFTSDSCLMQVYCCLLEVVFPLYLPINEEQFKLLTVICYNHVRLLFYCLTNPPDFVHKMLPPDYYDDEDENDIETSSNNAPVREASTATSVVPNSSATNNAQSTASENTAEQTNLDEKLTEDIASCHCYVQMCLGVLTMLYKVLREWIRNGKKWETARVSCISKVAVHLLHLIYCDHYIIRLFREDEDTTKHFFYLIITWWMENLDDLAFNEINKSFLMKLKESHIMPPEPNEEGNLSNIEKDFAQWCRVTGDTDVLSNKDPETTVQDLGLLKDAFDPAKFFADLEEKPINFK